jgi:hypothetical protein
MELGSVAMNSGAACSLSRTQLKRLVQEAVKIKKGLGHEIEFKYFDKNV